MNMAHSEDKLKEGQRQWRVDALLREAKKAIDAGENFMHVAAEKIADAAEQGATQRKIAEDVGKSAAWVNTLLQWRLGGYQGSCFGPQAKAKRVKAERAKTEHTERVFSQTKHDPASMTEAQAQAATAKAHADFAKAEADKAKAEAAKAKANERARKAEAEANERARKAEAKATTAKAKASARWAEEAEARARQASAEAADRMFAGMGTRSFGGIGNSAGIGPGGYGSKRPEMTKAERTKLVALLNHLGNSNDGERDMAARKADAMREKLGVGWNDLIVRAFR